MWLPAGRELRVIADSTCAEYKKNADEFRNCWAEKHFEVVKKSSRLLLTALLISHHQARKRVLFKSTALGNADFAS